MSRFAPGTFAPIAIASRSGLDESLHHGAAVAVDAAGVVAASLGDADLEVYPRSALKPFQAAAMVAAGLDLPHRLLAVVAASHSGEPPHLAAALEILERHGLSEDDLQNTPAYPYGRDARRAAIASGTPKSAVQQNCSGKHAAMLATCRVNGWPTESYLEADHPVQQAITAEINRLVGRSAITHIGVDGCGAPTHVMPLVDVARSMRTMMLESSDVVEAMAAHPEMAAGSRRDVTLWMKAVPGLAAKEGADGVMVVALSDGRAGALKIADGSDRARQVATIELLRQMGVDVDRDHASVVEQLEFSVLGHGHPVGSLRSLPWAST